MRDEMQSGFGEAVAGADGSSPAAYSPPLQGTSTTIDGGRGISSHTSDVIYDDSGISPDISGDISGNSVTLRTHLEDLPQEIYDMIKDLAFICDTETRFDQTLSKHIDFIRIDESHKPPVQLRVSRETRENFSKIYYGTTFVFASSRSAQMWVRCVSPANKRMLCDIRYIDARIETLHDRDAMPWYLVIYDAYFDTLSLLAYMHTYKPVDVTFAETEEKLFEKPPFSPPKHRRTYLEPWTGPEVLEQQ